MSENLATALAKVQGQLAAVKKDKTAQVRSEKGSYSYDYADLASVQDAVFPLLAAEGLAWSAKPTLSEHGFVLSYSLIHGESGEREDGLYPLPDPTRGTPQQIGSAVTYARRYCLSAVVGVATEDDDGKAASDGAAPKPTRRQKPEGSAADAAHHQRELTKGGPRAERGPIPPEADPWADVEVAKPPVVTDADWLKDISTRIAMCDAIPVLRGLYDEVGAQVKAGAVSQPDAADLRLLIEEQSTELGKTASVTA